MSNLFGSARLYVIALFIGQLLATTVYAEGRWIKLAPFPEPSEELLGAAAGGKMYAFAGLAPGWKPKGLVYEYDPASDKWTKKKPMALASHHVGLVEYRPTPGRRWRRCRLSAARR